MIIELNARRNFTGRFLAKKKKISKEDKGTTRKKERKRDRVSIFRESDSPRASTCSTCPPSEDLSVLHILLLSHPFTRVRVHIHLDTANVPTHLSPLPTETLALPSIFFFFFFFSRSTLSLSFFSRFRIISSLYIF